jgi:hypothetical protein
MVRAIALAMAAAVLTACATPYGEQGLLGGFSAIELRPDVWRVNFQGNGYTTRETAQTYWLNRCAELTLEKGYASFEILSDMQFVMSPVNDDGVAPPHNRLLPASRITVLASGQELADASAWRGDDAGTVRHGRPRDKVASVAARSVPVFIYSGGGYGVPKPGLEGDIHMIKRPSMAPPKMFDAKVLKAALEPHMSSDKCGTGNVCPHVHEYLLPPGKLR